MYRGTESNHFQQSINSRFGAQTEIDQTRERETERESEADRDRERERTAGRPSNNWNNGRKERRDRETANTKQNRTRR